MIRASLYYIGKDLFRKLLRILKQSPLYFIMAIIAALFMIPISLEMLLAHQQLFLLIFPYIIYLYAVIKYMQNNPLITIKLPYFQFKMYNLKALKVYIILKISLPAILVGTAISVLVSNFPSAIIIALLINIVINYLCFIRYQVTSKKLLLSSLGVVLVIGFYAIYAQNMYIPISMLVLCCIHLIKIKKMDYSILYPYYKTMNKIGEGLLNKDFTKIFEAQQILSNHQVQKNRQNAFAFYENSFRFFLYREYSKLIFHQKDIINIVIGMLIVHLCYIIAPHPYEALVYGILLFLINYTLTLITKQEVELMKRSTIFNIRKTNYLKMKYLVNLILTLILVILNVWIFKDIFLVSLIIIWIMPLLNLMYVFIDNKIGKYIIVFVQGIFYALPYLLIFFHVV